MSNMYGYLNDCPMCGAVSTMALTLEEANAVSLYESGMGVLIQDVLPNLNPFEREFIKTGYCVKCQEQLFSRKAPENTRVQLY